ncbi:hypothetical protein KR222_000075, partial [Zaprionus bogoriensis]
MPAVVRIKRRIDEEPHTAFVLNGKRRRLQNDENAPATASATATSASASAADNKEEELSQVLLKFAGTLNSQDDSATRQFAAAARLNKDAAKELVRQSNDPAIASAQRRDRQRQEAQQAAREQRYRVVNCLRSTLHEADADAAAGNSNSSSSGGGTAEPHITIVDIESQQQQQQGEQAQAQAQALPAQQQPQQPADSDIGYVYDLYVPEDEAQAAYVDLMDDNYLSLRPLDEIVLEDCYNDADEDYDSEDSNQENYYTNDYPDDEEAGGGDVAAGSDEELCRQMNRFMFDDDEDEEDQFVSGSSEDDGEFNTFHDPYVHSIDTDADAFVDDVDFYNVERQGSAYERYRRRILREAEQLDSQSEADTDADADSGEDARFE